MLFNCSICKQGFHCETMRDNHMQIHLKAKGTLVFTKLLYNIKLKIIR